MKLATIDLDGTLLNAQGEIPEENLEALRRFDAQGGIVVLATGRSIHSATEAFAKLAINGYTLASNGAYAARIEQGEIAEVLNGFTIPSAVVETTFALAKEKQVTVVASRAEQDDRIVFDPASAEVNSPYYAQFKLADTSPKELIGHLKNTGIRYFKLAFNSPDTTKLAALRSAFNVKKITSTYSAKYWLEVMADDVNKGTALNFLLDYLKISQSESIAFGDQENDLEMLQFAGTSVAMENAIPLIKQTAAQTTSSNDEAGVAAVINTYL
ncbi:HAD family hydrolase [Enterococcus viikkiensis]|uniref:HAD family hydrolase n=1 Tax=Enterococcus viikkiensis TaxID=930854 RepID=UPI0010F8C237|nr:HAD family hydrolase [Enterococcus viikkiensis]